MNARFLWPWCASLLLLSSVFGYDLQLENGQPVKWDAGTVTMKLLFNPTPVLSDGSTYLSSVQTALQTWNSQIATVQFVGETGFVVSPANNSVNEIAFDSTVYGTGFDANVLAITVFYYSTNNPRSDGSYRRTQADIIFNAAYTWDSYRGPLRSSEDIQRVALHELGHVLGLDHPDQASPPQSVNAQMNSHVSNLDALTSDDIAGAQSLYGTPVSAPGITTHPVNQSVYTSQTAQFTIVATGNPAPAFRWQRKPNGGVAWSDLSDAGSYSGSTTTILSVAAAVPSMSGDQFRCVATNAGGSATSNAASLTVMASLTPVISSQPLSQTVLEGNGVTFSAAASGVPSPTFQWQKNGADIAGANGSSYTIPIVLAADAGSYRVVASNLAGSVISNAALLAVNFPPVISNLSPTRQVLTLGQSLNLSVTATGTGALGYQWIHNGRAITGATGSSFAISNTVISDRGWYVVLITDANGTRRSPPLFVTIKPSAISTHIVGWGSNSLGQTNIPVGLSSAVALAAGDDVSLALESDGSVIGWGANSYGNSVPVGLSNVVALAIGTSHSVALKDDGTVVSWGDASYGLSSTAANLSTIVAVTAGFHYSMALKADGTVVSWGDTSSSYHQTDVPLGLSNVVAIAGNNVSSLALKSDGTVIAWGSNSAGQTNVPAGLTNVVAVATGSGHSLALKADGAVVAWGDNVYGQTVVPVGLNGVIAISARGVVSFALKEDGTVVSWGNDSANQSAFPQSQVPFGLSVVQEICAGGKHALALCSGPVVLPAFTLQPASTTVASGSPVSFTVTVSGSAPFTFRWQRSPSGSNTWTDVGAGGSSASLSIATSTLAMNKDQLRCIVSNSLGSATSNAATLTVISGAGAPRITAQPLPTTVSAGQPAFFSVVATGSAILAYQWQLYNEAGDFWYNIGSLVVFTPPSFYIPPVYVGETTASLRINTSSELNSGGLALSGIKFRCLITNSEGNTTSNEAILVVLPSPSFTTQPLSHTVLAGGGLTITGSAAGYPAPSYQWQRNGIDIAGATSATLTLTNIQMTDAGNYTLVATNSFGTVISNPAVLTVIPGTGVSGAALGDFDGDGKADLVWSNSVTGERSMWFLNGNTLSGGASLGVVPVAWVVSATADFDGDGRADIFWTNTTTGDRAIWLMNGSAMRTNTFMGTVPVDWVISGTGDFNGDGKADLVWTNTTTGDRAMWLMKGSTVLGGGYLGTVPVAWTISGVGDFNGDGKADLVWSNTLTGERSMWFQNGSTTISGATLNTVPVAWVISGVGDFNGDGKADIFLTNTVSGDRVIWLMNGSTITTNAFMGTVLVEWTISGTGDFNGDKKKDLFWTNTANGDRAMWLLNGVTVLGGGYMGTVPVEWKINN